MFDVDSYLTQNKWRKREKTKQNIVPHGNGVSVCNAMRACIGKLKSNGMAGDMQTKFKVYYLHVFFI